MPMKKFSFADHEDAYFQPCLAIGFFLFLTGLIIRNWDLQVAILVVLNFLIYFKVIWYGYVIDDDKVGNYPGLEKWKARNFMQLFYWEIKPWRYYSSKRVHLYSTLIHILVCCMIYIVFGRNLLSFLTALLFTANPVVNQVSAWANAKRYAVNTLLVLCMWMMPAWAMLFYFWTPFWQVSAATAPLLFIGTKYWLWMLGIPFIIFIGGKRLIYRFLARKLQSPDGVLPQLSWRKLILYVKTFGYYFWYCVFPVRIGMWHYFLYLLGMSEEENRKCFAIDWRFWFGLVTFIGVLAVMLIFRGTPLSFGLFWFTIFISLWGNLLTLTQSIADRYCYLPLVGLSYAQAWVILKLGGWLWQFIK